MIQAKEKTTALISSVGAGEGQSFQKNIVSSISDRPEKSNDPDESFLAMHVGLQYMLDSEGVAEKKKVRKRAASVKMELPHSH